MEDRNGVKHCFINVEGFKEFAEQKDMESLAERLDFKNLTQAGIQAISKKDYDAIVDQTPEPSLSMAEKPKYWIFSTSVENWMISIEKKIWATKVESA